MKERIQQALGLPYISKTDRQLFVGKLVAAGAIIVGLVAVVLIAR